MTSMGNLKTNKENKLLKQYATSIAVDREISNQGKQQLDLAISDAKKAEEYLDKRIELKTRLRDILLEVSKTGMNESARSEILIIKNELTNLETLKVHSYEHVDTQEVSGSFEEMNRSNLEFAKKYELDLSDPFMAMFSTYEQNVISNELAEKFDLLRLDKYDYAFASFVGVLGGIVDILLVGTASTKTEQSGKLVQITDKAYGKAVQKYAKLNGWTGPKKDSDPTKSAIGFLERKFKVPYDARYAKDTENIIKDIAPQNHHLRSLSHSFGILGLVVGILDNLSGKATYYDLENNCIKHIPGTPINEQDQVRSIFDAVQKWFGHCMSDIAGSSGSTTRGTGLPTTLESILQRFQVGKVPISGKTANNIKYETIGNTITQMYEGGFDKRFATATAIPVLVCEALVRIYWFLKIHYYYGKPLKDSIPFGKDREMQRLLLITSFCFSTVDVTGAIIKGAAEQNPLTFLTSVNYVQLANLGYKLWVNFRLEHEHNEKVKELMEREVKIKFEELINADPVINSTYLNDSFYD